MRPNDIMNPPPRHFVDLRVTPDPRRRTSSFTQSQRSCLNLFQLPTYVCQGNCLIDKLSQVSARPYREFPIGSREAPSYGFPSGSELHPLLRCFSTA